MSGVLRLFADGFRRDPVKCIDKLGSVVVYVANCLVGLFKYFHDTPQQVAARHTTDLELKNTHRSAVRQLRRIVLKGKEYIDSAEALCGMKTQGKDLEETIRREEDRYNIVKLFHYFIHGRRPSGLKTFLAELNLRVKALDGIRGVIVELCNQLMNECNDAIRLAGEKEREAESRK